MIMKRFLSLVLTLFLLQTGFAQNVIPINGNSWEHSPELYTSGDQSGDFKASRRYREITVNPQLQKKQEIRMNDVIQLDLFQNRQYKARVDKLETDVNGTFSVRARLEGFEYAWCFISTTEGKSLITVEIPEKDELYITRLNPKNGKYFLLDLDRKKTESLEGSPSMVPPKETEQKNPVNETGTSSGTEQTTSSVSVNDVNSPDVVSVMIVYTPSAASWALSSEGGINNTISQIMQKSNLALGNSNSLLQFELVYSGEVNYTELNTSDDLYRLTNTADGYMDEVHSLRNTYGADVVVLLENISFTGGIGWLLNSTSGSPAYAFSITRVQQASFTYTAVHEVGHNMGCHHSKLQNYQPGPGIFSYSAGWRWVGTNGGKYCSVMTYESGSYFADGQTHTRVPYFSNPSINYYGVPTGNAVDGDNARTLRETKGVVAAYRSAPCITPTQQATAFSSTNVTSNSMTISWTRGNGSQVLVVARQGSAVNSNPVNGTGYTANALFGSGTQIGTGNYVVYNGTGSTVNVSGLVSGTNYYFAAFEYNSPSNCYLTPGLTGNATTQFTVPVAPVAKAASGITQSAFVANWNASSGATGYFLDVATDNTFTTGLILNNVSTGNFISYTVSGLTASTTYFYRLRASNIAGTSSSSNVITVTTLAPASPTAPVATAATLLTPSGFNANWNSSSGAAGYRLDVSTSSRFSGFVAGYDNKEVGNTTTFALTGLSSKTTYYYRVRAYNTGGTSASSNRITVTTLSSLGVPDAVAATNTSATGFSANWNAAAGASGYYLDVATNSTFSKYVTGYKNLKLGNVTSAAITGLAAGKIYYYRVRAYNATETSANSYTITVTTPASLKSAEIASTVPDVSPAGLFTSHPNPFGREVTISYSVAEKGWATLEILDITGRLVKTLVSGVQEAGLYQITWDPGEESNPGIYIGRFRSGEFSKSLKLIYQGK